MAAGKVKSMEKTQKGSEPSLPARAFTRQPSPVVTQPTFETAMIPQMAGNLAIQRLLSAGAIQAKLSLGQPNDPYEQEADRVAHQIVSKRSPTCASGRCLCDDCTAKAYLPSVQRKAIGTVNPQTAP